MESIDFNDYLNVTDFDFDRFNLMQLRIFGNEHSLPFIRVAEPRNDEYQAYLAATIPLERFSLLINYLAATALQAVPLTPNNITPYLGVAKTVKITDNEMEVTTKKNVTVTVKCASQYAVTLPPVEGLSPLPIKGFAADTVLRICVPLAIESKKVVSKDATTLTSLHNNVFSTTYGTQCATIMRPKIEPLSDLPAHSKGFGFLGYIYTKMHRANPTGLSTAMMMARQSETSVIRNLTQTVQHPIPDIDGNLVPVQVVSSKPTYVPSCPVLDFDVIPLMYYNSVQNVHGGNGSTSSQFNTVHVDGLPIESGDRDFIDRCKDLSLILKVLPDTVTDFYINTGDPTYCKKIHKQIIHSRRANKQKKVPIFVHHVHGTDMTNESYTKIRAQTEGGVVFHAALPDDGNGCFLSLESSVIENASTPVDIEQKMKLKHSGFLSKLKCYYGWHFVVDSYTLGASLPKDSLVFYYPSSRGNVCNCIIGYTRPDKFEREYLFCNEVNDKNVAHKTYNLSYENIQYHVYHQIKHAHQLRFHRSIWNDCVNDLNQAATQFANENNMQVMAYHRIPGVMVYYLTPEEEADINASMWGSTKYVNVSLEASYVDNAVAPVAAAPRPPPLAPFVNNHPPRVPAPPGINQNTRNAPPRQPPVVVPNDASPSAPSAPPLEQRGTSVPPVGRSKNGNKGGRGNSQQKQSKKQQRQQQQQQGYSEQEQYQSFDPARTIQGVANGGRGNGGRNKSRGRSATPKNRSSPSPAPSAQNTNRVVDPSQQQQQQQQQQPAQQQFVQQTQAPAPVYTASLTEKTDLSLYS